MVVRRWGRERHRWCLQREVGARSRKRLSPRDDADTRRIRRRWSDGAREGGRPLLQEAGRGCRVSPALVPIGGGAHERRACTHEWLGGRVARVDGSVHGLQLLLLRLQLLLLRLQLLLLLLRVQLRLPPRISLQP